MRAYSDLHVHVCAGWEPLDSVEYLGAVVRALQAVQLLAGLRCSSFAMSFRPTLMWPQG
jgi:hypothetical protein